jgi:hypothetical protein
LHLKTWGNKTSGIKPSLLFPKAFFENGRSSGFLFYRPLPALFELEQWIIPVINEITAAGTAPVFHRIPYSY